MEMRMADATGEGTSTELSKAGYQLLKSGNLAEAEQRFQAILNTDPTNHYALVGLGDVSRRQGRFSDAQERYQECLRHHPLNKFALIGLAGRPPGQSRLSRCSRHLGPLPGAPP